MKTINQFIIFSLLLVFFSSSFAQTDQAKAVDLGRQAILLEDEGKFDEALKLLGEAQKLDPGKIDYLYEMAYSYYGMKNYNKAMNILLKLKDRDDTFDRVYQLLGNSYDLTGKRDKAITTYEEGLVKFPSSGDLYLELGVVYLFPQGKKDRDVNKALDYFEKGIEVEPTFPSNYYWAARIFCGSTEAVWGMIYGEIFMNMERGSQRTETISKLLYDTYKSQITFESKNKITVSFCKMMTINVDDIDTNNIKLPFGLMVYEPLISLSLVNEDKIDINSLDRIRTEFVDQYYKREFDKKYPNILFEYQKEIIEAGHFEAYNHWLLMKGDDEAFNKWYENNKKKYDDFIEWYKDNSILVDETHTFHRRQY